MHTISQRDNVHGAFSFINTKKLQDSIFDKKNIYLQHK